MEGQLVIVDRLLARSALILPRCIDYCVRSRAAGCCARTSRAGSR